MQYLMLFISLIAIFLCGCASTLGLVGQIYPGAYATYIASALFHAALFAGTIYIWFAAFRPDLLHARH